MPTGWVMLLSALTGLAIAIWVLVGLKALELLPWQ